MVGDLRFGGLSEARKDRKLVPVRLLDLIMIRVFGRLVLLGLFQLSKDAEIMVLRREVVVLRLVAGPGRTWPTAKS